MFRNKFSINILKSCVKLSKANEKSLKFGILLFYMYKIVVIQLIIKEIQSKQLSIV